MKGQSSLTDRPNNKVCKKAFSGEFREMTTRWVKYPTLTIVIATLSHCTDSLSGVVAFKVSNIHIVLCKCSDGDEA